jgi:hypothetical protein
LAELLDNRTYVRSSFFLLPRDRTEVAVQDDNDEALIRSIDAEHAGIAAAQRRLFG